MRGRKATCDGKRTRAARPDPAPNLPDESLETKLLVKVYFSSIAEDMIRRGADKLQIDAILEQLRTANAELSEHVWRCREVGCPTPGGNANPCSLPVCVACGAAWTVYSGARARIAAADATADFDVATDGTPNTPSTTAAPPAADTIVAEAMACPLSPLWRAIF